MPGWTAFARLITFTAVVVAWVFFRAANVDAAIVMLKGMAGMNGLNSPECWLTSWSVFGNWLINNGAHFPESDCFDGNAIQITWIGVLLLVCWTFPNTQEIFSTYRPALVSPGYRNIMPGKSALNWMWNPTLGWLTVIAGLGIYALLSISEFSEFIYFRF